MCVWPIRLLMELPFSDPDPTYSSNKAMQNWVSKCTFHVQFCVRYCWFYRPDIWTNQIPVILSNPTRSLLTMTLDLETCARSEDPLGCYMNPCYTTTHTLIFHLPLLCWDKGPSWKDPLVKVLRAVPMDRRLKQGSPKNQGLSVFQWRKSWQRVSLTLWHTRAHTHTANAYCMHAHTFT